MLLSCQGYTYVNSSGGITRSFSFSMQAVNLNRKSFRGRGADKDVFTNLKFFTHILAGLPGYQHCVFPIINPDDLDLVGDNQIEEWVSLSFQINLSRHIFIRPSVGFMYMSVTVSITLLPRTMLAGLCSA